MYLVTIYSEFLVTIYSVFLVSILVDLKTTYGYYYIYFSDFTRHYTGLLRLKEDAIQLFFQHFSGKECWKCAAALFRVRARPCMSIFSTAMFYDR